MSERQNSRQSNSFQCSNGSKKPLSQPANIFNFRWLLLGLGFSAIAVVSATVGAFLALSVSNTPLRQAKLTPAQEAVFNQEETLTFDNLQIPKLSRPVNILVLGIKVLTSDVPEQSHPDLGYHALVNSFEGLSDSMLLLRFDPEKDYVTVLSIPRDTKTLIPNRGVMKINEANALGGPALAAESVSKLLDDVTIDRYIRINVQGVEKLIDALGGLNIYVPENMKYTDHSQHLYIDLKQGQQHLDGEKAIQFLRFRYDTYGDIGRVQRQQSFMRALVEQTLSPRTILKMPDILNVVRSHLDTNLTTNELIAMAGFAAQKNRTNIKMVMLPGDFNTPAKGELSYWLPNHDKIREIMAQHFDVGSSYFSTNDQSDYRNLKIAVQSSKEDQEIAQNIVRYLRENGYSRAYLSYNFHPQRLPKTKIIAQQGDNYAAAQLRADLGVGEVIVESTGVINSDLTIQVGSDWLDSHANPAENNEQDTHSNFQTISY